MSAPAAIGTTPVVGAPAVALAIADFLVRTETERLRLFRLHLRATVNRVSPLLLELAMMEGMSLAEAVALIHPPQDWPWRPIVDGPPSLLRRSQRFKGLAGWSGRSEVARFRQTFANPGVVIRDADHPRGRFAIRPCAPAMGFTIAIGPCLLSAFGSSAMLKLPEQLPETLMAAMPGRPVGQIIDHPALGSAEYTIRRVMPDLADGLPVITFRAPLVPFAMSFPSGRGDVRRDAVRALLP